MDSVLAFLKDTTPPTDRVFDVTQRGTQLRFQASGQEESVDVLEPDLY